MIRSTRLFSLLMAMLLSCMAAPTSAAAAPPDSASTTPHDSTMRAPTLAHPAVLLVAQGSAVARDSLTIPDSARAAIAGLVTGTHATVVSGPTWGAAFADSTRAVRAFLPVARSPWRSVRSTPLTNDSTSDPSGAAPIAMAMAALAAARDTKRRGQSRRSYPVGAGKTIHQGSIVVLGAGYAEPGTTALNKTFVGMAAETIDNSGGGAGDVRVEVEAGFDFLFANDGSITEADLGKTAYIVDDQTVADSDGGGTRSAAGQIVGVDVAGVWIKG